MEIFEVRVGKRVAVKSRKEAVKTVLLGAHQAEPGFKRILQNKLLQMTNPINYIEHPIELKHFMSFLVPIQCEGSQQGEIEILNTDIFTCAHAGLAIVNVRFTMHS